LKDFSETIPRYVREIGTTTIDIRKNKGRIDSIGPARGPISDAKAEFGTKNKLTRTTIPQRLDLLSSILAHRML